MLQPSSLINGEKFQFECDCWLGTRQDFDNNPRVKYQYHRQMDFDRLNAPWENPPTIFCYSYLIARLCEKLSRNLILRPFVLVTHNSAYTMTPLSEDQRSKGVPCPMIFLLGHPKLIRWHSSNVNYEHPKLKPLPLGLANPQHPHGNSSAIAKVLWSSLPQTQAMPYLHFDLSTRPEFRKACMQTLTDKGYVRSEGMAFEDYVPLLATHKFAFCPMGLAMDTHRLWECLYLGVIPIVLRSKFTELLDRYVIPQMLLMFDSWDQVPAAEDLSKLHDLAKPLRTIRNDPGVAFLLSAEVHLASITFGIITTPEPA
jgi:hypothetical protein